MDITAFARFLPDIWDIILVSPLAILYVLLIGWIAHLAKRRFSLKTGYSRKIFHFCIFTTALVLGTIFPLHRVAAFGAGAGLVVLGLVLFHEKKFLSRIYGALAREKDAPHRSLYLIMPFIATAIGGLVTGILFPLYFQVGYLAAGWGDAAGEPVGVRFGKHKYRAPTLSKTKCTRSVEGSLGVFLSTFFAACLILFSLDYGIQSLWLAAGAALVTALVEAVSPHGWDNFTTQLAGCVGVYLVLMV